MFGASWRYCKWRSRGTEDIGIIRRISGEEFENLHKNLTSSGFQCIRGNLPKELYEDYLNENLAVRHVLEGRFVPEMELKLEKEELVKLYLLFGGYPKYYVAIEDFGLQGQTAEEIVNALFLAKDAPLEDEVNGILSQEFGGRSGIYYSILESIASGNNTLSSIAGSLNTPVTSITRQANELKDLFEIIELEMPYEGKRGAYRIRHPLLESWFSQIYRNYSDYSARKPEFVRSVKNNLNAFYGKRFERAAAEFLSPALALTEAKRQWGKIPGGKRARTPTK
ncbi:hypothetical protein HY095_04560 [Candidatus Micrarchaeota archaeon]|nr:hypothetical protein [Candidatus Micrarchaeota archaeon]